MRRAGGEAAAAPRARRRSTTRSRRRAPTAATCPSCDRGEALDYLADGARARARARRRATASATALHELVLRHEHQHAETMLQTIELARLDGTGRPGRRRGAARRAAGTPASSSSTSPPARSRIGRARRGLRLRQRAPAPRGRRPRPSGSAARRSPTPPSCASSRAAATSAASGGRDEGWAWKEEYDITHPGGWTADGREWRVAGWEPLDPDGPWSTSPGSRPTPSLAHTALASPPRRSGRRRRPGTRSGRDAPLPVGRRAAGAAPRATSPSAPARHRRRRRAPGRRRAVRRARACSATSGSGRAAEFGGYPGFAAHPYREYSEVFFGGDYRVLRGGSWATRGARRHTHLPQLGPPPAPPDLRGHPGRGRRLTDGWSVSRARSWVRGPGRGSASSFRGLKRTL